MKYYRLLLFLALFFFTACEHDDAFINKYDKTLTKIECLSFRASLLDRELSDAIERLYPFNKGCAYRLEASQKSGIVCNSNQNIQKKVLSNFPSTYLRLDVYRESQIVYSYYKDLSTKPSQEDIKKAFLRLTKDIGLIDAKTH